MTALGSVRPPRVAGAKRQRLALDVRREQLVELGLAIFSERAYDEVSIDEIAREAGISKGLLYHYFPNKRDFYVACLAEAAERLVDFTKTDPSLLPLERSTIGLDAYLSYVEEHARAYTALMRGGIGFDEEVSRICENTREKMIARMLEDMNAEVLPPIARYALKGWIGFVEAASIDWVTTKRISRDELRDMLQEILITLLMRFGPPRAGDR